MRAADWCAGWLIAPVCWLTERTDWEWVWKIHDRLLDHYIARMGRGGAKHVD